MVLEALDHANVTAAIIEVAACYSYKKSLGIVLRAMNPWHMNGCNSDEALLDFESRARTYLISVKQPMISTTSPASVNSGKIDNKTHTGSCTGAESAEPFPGASKLRFKRSSSDL
jgi:hypothetical protein